jgi:hypothetical protein
MLSPAVRDSVEKSIRLGEQTHKHTDIRALHFRDLEEERERERKR